MFHLLLLPQWALCSTAIEQQWADYQLTVIPHREYVDFQARSGTICLPEIRFYRLCSYSTVELVRVGHITVLPDS